MITFPILLNLLKIFEQKKVKGSASKANKDCQVLLFDVHVVNRASKVSFKRRISEDDGELVVSTLHSNVLLLYSIIKAIVLCRYRPHTLLGTLSNEDGNVNDHGSEKSPFWFALYFFVRAISVLIFCLKLCQ